MPEGDSLFRLARTLAPALEGQVVKSLVLPRSDVPTAHLAGRPVKKVEALGKNLLIHFGEGSSLHVHLRMNGVVHLQREGAPFRRAESKVVFVLTVPGWVAVGYEAPTVRLMRSRDLAADGRLSGLGPDLLGETFDELEALRRLRLRGRQPLGHAVMDQAAVAGIGNVYKSEILFNLGLDPFALVERYGDDELLAVLREARKLLQKNVVPARKDRPPDAFERAFVGKRVTRSGCEVGKGPVSVYGRMDRACFVCGATIRMERQGDLLRSTYYCPLCQPSRQPGPQPSPEAEAPVSVRGEPVDPSSSRGS